MQMANANTSATLRACGAHAQKVYHWAKRVGMGEWSRPRRADSLEAWLGWCAGLLCQELQFRSPL
jgi:hypothetical protein